VILSTSKKFIFIHIWKTAGTSITKELIKYGTFRQRIAEKYFLTRKAINAVNRVFSLEDKGNKWFTGVHKHAPAKDVKNYIGNECWEKYYSFAFVRNPFDWLVSWYFYVRQSKGRHAEYQAANEIDFKDFVLDKINHKCPTQWDFVSCDGELIVDYVGKLESLQSDFDEVCNHLGLANEKVGFLNNSKRGDFLNYYDEALIKSVEEYFKDDFLKFGYNMISVKNSKAYD